MSRKVEITVPTERTEALLEAVHQVAGTHGIRLHRGGSLRPAGDVVSVEISNLDLPELMRRLAEAGILGGPGTVVTTTAPMSLVVADMSRVDSDTSEGTWEEVAALLVRDSHMGLNGLTLMFVAGALAAIGLEMNALHVVVGAMLVAPGFEPLTRIALGLVAGGRTWRRGLQDTLRGYLALLGGAVLAAVSLRLLGILPVPGEGSYLPPGTLVSYWSEVTAPSVLASATAAVGGGVLVAATRTVLTGGVMIALALVPSLALVGLGLVAGDAALAGSGLARWAIDAALVVGGSALVFALKRHRVHGRQMVA